MVALTAKKNLSLPHLSLSRTSSPSRSNSLNSAPTTPSSTTPTPTSTAPTSPNLNTNQASSSSTSFFSLDRKKSKSTSPKPRPVVDNLSSIEPTTIPSLPPPTSSSRSRPSTADPSRTARGVGVEKSDNKLRRSSFGNSLSTTTTSSSSFRSHSPAAPAPGTKSSTIVLPAGLSLTPASAQISQAETSTSNSNTNTTGGGGGGFKPLQAAIAKSAGVVKDRSGALLMRSKSSDRASEVSLVPSSSSASTVGGELKKKGMMGTVRGLALGQSVSQPAQSRLTNGIGGGGANNNAGGGGGGHPAPIRTSSFHSGMMTTSSEGSTTTPTSATSTSQVHQLAESHVSQISLRMSETVNKVFMPSAHGAAGQQLDKLEGTFFVPSSAVQEATGGKGRPCPRVVKSREFGEMLVAELHGAVHDSYLLRTILRSSVLKALSLFLSRLSALLLVPTSPSDPAFKVPLSIPKSSKDAKSQETDQHFSNQFPLALRYNLHIVRCATTVKHYLLELTAQGGGGGGGGGGGEGFPSFVEETLRPWRGKLSELISRVMNPVVASYKSAVIEACKKSRIEGGLNTTGGGKEDPNSRRGRANSGERSALGLTLVAPTPGGRSASQGRSLSLGRSSTPTPLAMSSTSASQNGGGGGSAGPAWLQEATAIFDVCSRLFQRLDARTDTDRWAVGIAIAATWKGMLGCSARIISEDGIVPSSSTTAASTNSTAFPATTVPAPVKSRLLGGVKKTPSPPPSPPLPAINLGTNTSNGSLCSNSPNAATVAFVRLISDLELFEHRLVHFLSSTLSSPQVVFHPSVAPVDACPGAPSCGLCKTGRTFDEESNSSDEEGRDDSKGGESRLALSAMREAMQALSSMIVVVRASRDLKILEQALRSDCSTSAPASVPSESSPPKPTNAPLTPSDLFALGPARPTLPPAPTATSSITIVSPSPAHPACPTLRAALIDLHPLILLHLVLSRLPRSLPFRLPHEIWALRGEWQEYESELRGFAAGEEWAGEIAWEIKGEIVRVRQETTPSGLGLNAGEEAGLKVLEETVERVSRDSA